ncbi:MAG: Ca-activated chloride channel family protein [Desulforhopalus sp.]|jgi:Ca-activated chloride channel family protein
MKNYMGRSNKLRKRAVVAGFVCSFFMVVVCLVDNEYNLLTEDQKGYQLFQKDQFDMAVQEFNSLSWKGVALYRNGQFEEAASAFSGMDSPEGCLNHGNSLVMLGKYEDAIERYERALTLKPAWPPAMTNLALARTRAKALEKKGGEMTGGKLGADEYVFSNKSSEEKGEEEMVAGGEPSEAEQRAIWLRQIQTKPADFLRTKFAYQYQMAESSTALSDGKGAEPTSEQK